MDDYKIVHGVILKAAILLNKTIKNDVVAIGNELLAVGSDDLTCGGFWIWGIENGTEFYSPKFREVLGFEGEHDFPNVPESWQKQLSKKEVQGVFETYAKHEKTGGAHPYYQTVTYNKKGGGTLKIICSGTLIRRGKNPWLLVGTHKLIK